MNGTGSMALYSGLRDEVIALVRPLASTDLERSVPLTPGWTVREVVAHVCGLNADIAAGARTELGTAESTRRQVDRRAHQSIGETCDEWVSCAAGMRKAIDEDPFFGRRLAADLVVHLHDLQHCLGRSIDRSSVGSVSGGQTYAARIGDRWVGIGGVWVAIELSDGTRFEPTSPPSDGMETLTLRATPYDVLRSVTGRRSRRQVRALDWSGDPDGLIDVFSPYGPLRNEDADV